MSRSGTAFSENQDLASAYRLASDAPMTDTLAVILMMDATARSGIVSHEIQGNAVALALAASLRPESQDRASACSLASGAPMKDTLAVLLMMGTASRSGIVGQDEIHGYPVASASTVSLRPASRRALASTSPVAQRTIETPNKSFNRTRHGMRPGPSGASVHHAPHGPGRTPRRAG